MSSPRRSGRVVTIVNGATAAGLVALLAGVALVVNPPAPPGIAEFAPQATKPISKAPQSQGASTGRGGPGRTNCGTTCRPTPSAVPYAVGPSATATPGPGTVASALQCYTWPDGSVTQTFDPQSPPCVASWTGAAKGNGGATSRGVSATAIRIAWPTNGLVATNTSATTVQPWADFFNSHFTLYGRKLVIVPVKATSLSPSDEHAAAVSAADQNVFASLDLTGTHGSTGPDQPGFYDDLAKRQVITVSAGGGFTTEKRYESYAPYQWSYLPPQDTLQRATGTMTCQQLAAHPASHSTQFRTTPRVFAILVDRSASGNPPPSTSGFRETLAQCGVRPKTYEMTNGNGGADDIPTFVQMRNDGVTTVLAVNPGHGTGGTGDHMAAASRAGYFPEWIVPGGLGDEYEAQWSDAPTTEAQGLFGLAGWNRRARTNTSPALQAFGPRGEAADRTFYDQLQILAAGIQAAGPRLTPQTFATGLQGLDYANPGAGAAPDYQGSVGFAQDHSAVDDFALVWWSTTGTSRQDPGGAPRQPGSWCYVGGGTRWQADDLPKTDRFGDRASSQC